MKAVMLLLLLLAAASTGEGAVVSPSSCPERCRCDLASSPRKVDCSGLGLTVFPLNLHSSTQYLDLSHNNLSSLPPRLGHQVPQLETLLLNHNSLQKITPDALRGLFELRRVNVAHNLIQGGLPSSLLSSNPRILELQLAHNPSVPGVGELRSTSLELLDLSACNVTSLHDASLAALPALRLLNVSLNPLTSVPANLSSPSLRVLDLTQCQLSSLPHTALASLPRLQQLHISRNKELDLPVSLASKSLLQLTADHCSIQHAAISRLSALTHAYFSCNKIVTVTRQHFARNSALLEIDLAQNLIRELPIDVFLNASHLVSVDLSGNQIESLQYDSFACCKELKFVNLSRNDITKLPDFLTMPAVEVMDLSRCRLQSLPKNPDFLNNMKHLKNLYLSHNELKDLPDLVSNSVKNLDVSYCHLTHIRNQTFSKLTELQRLDLSGNRLTSLNAAVFESNNNLGTLKLDDNPWRCNCTDPEFQSLYDLADQLSETGRNKLKCNDPEMFAGLLWEDACSDSFLQGASPSNTWLLTLTLLLALVALAGVMMCTRRLIGSDKHARRERRARHPQHVNRRGSDSSEDAVPSPRVPRIRVEDTCPPCQRSNLRSVEVQPPTYEEAVLMPPTGTTEPEEPSDVTELTTEVPPDDEANEGDVSASDSEEETTIPKCATTEVTVEVNQPQQTDL